MHSLRRTWQELWFVLRGAYPNAKAARLYGKALSLERKGRYEEAFAITSRALAGLPTPTNQISDPIVGVIVVITVLHANLALRIGTPRAAEKAVVRAIEVGSSSADIPEIRERIDWLRKFLEDPEDGRRPTRSQ